MNVDEAIAEISRHLLAVYSREDFKACHDALEVIRNHLARKVDDAMVERFMAVYGCPYSHADAVKSALVAALGVEGALDGINDHRGNPESPPCT